MNIRYRWVWVCANKSLNEKRGWQSERIVARWVDKICLYDNSNNRKKGTMNKTNIQINVFYVAFSSFPAKYIRWYMLTQHYYYENFCRHSFTLWFEIELYEKHSQPKASMFLLSTKYMRPIIIAFRTSFKNDDDDVNHKMIITNLMILIRWQWYLTDEDAACTRMGWCASPPKKVHHFI